MGNGRYERMKTIYETTALRDSKRYSRTSIMHISNTLKTPAIGLQPGLPPISIPRPLHNMMWRLIVMELNHDLVDFTPEIILLEKLYLLQTTISSQQSALCAR